MIGVPTGVLFLKKFLHAGRQNALEPVWMNQLGMIHLLWIQRHTPQGFYIRLRVDPC